MTSLQASVDNIDRLMEDMERNKEKMFKLKDSVVKLQWEEIDLKRKHDAILSEKERLQMDYQALET